MVETFYSFQGGKALKIALDLDGVVANLHDRLVTFFNEKGMHLNDDRYDLSIRGVKESGDLIQAAIHHIFDQDMSSVQPYEDALFFIKELDRLGPITFPTARNPAYNYNTIDWLNKYFDISFSFTNKSSVDKPKFIKDEGFDVFVEDRLRTANHAAALGVPVCLVTRPWNLYRPTHPAVRRVEGLGTVFSLLAAGKFGGDGDGI